MEAVLLDIIVLAIFAVFLFFGFKNGIIKSVLALVNLVVSAIASVHFSRILSNFVYEFFIKKIIIDQTNSLIVNNKIFSSVDLLQKLPKVFRNIILNNGINSTKIGNIISKVNRSYFIKTLGGEVRVLMSEIKYIEYSQKRLTFHTVDGCYTERGQIGELANRFESFGFIYIHQGYIVNAKWVRTIKRNTVLLTDGTEVMMSLKKRKEILEKCHTALKQT